MTDHRSWGELRAEVMSRPGAAERDGYLVVAGVDASLADVEEYLESIGARLEIVALFDDGRRFPVHLVSDVEP